jgi:hypothetical protein
MEVAVPVQLLSFDEFASSWVTCGDHVVLRLSLEPQPGSGGLFLIAESEAQGVSRPVLGNWTVFVVRLSLSVWWRFSQTLLHIELDDRVSYRASGETLHREYSILHWYSE